eukprot:2496864-Rhodomonas_salina.1
MASWAVLGYKRMHEDGEHTVPPSAELRRASQRHLGESARRKGRREGKKERGEEGERGRRREGMSSQQPPRVPPQAS